MKRYLLLLLFGIFIFAGCSNPIGTYSLESSSDNPVTGKTDVLTKTLVIDADSFTYSEIYSQTGDYENVSSEEGRTSAAYRGNIENPSFNSTGQYLWTATSLQKWENSAWTDIPDSDSPEVRFENFNGGGLFPDPGPDGEDQIGFYIDENNDGTDELSATKLKKQSN